MVKATSAKTGERQMRRIRLKSFDIPPKD